MDSCVYQPPAILKVQIYSFTIFEIKSNFSYFYRFFCIPLHENFHLNFVFGKLHFYLSSQLFFKKKQSVWKGKHNPDFACWKYFSRSGALVKNPPANSRDAYVHLWMCMYIRMCVYVCERYKQREEWHSEVI